MKQFTTIVTLFITILLSACGGKVEQAEEISPKKALLTKLVGEHKLISISALRGVNTMVDYSIDENGKWSAGESFLYGGMREFVKINLTKIDRARLESMKIIVAEDLTIKISCNGKDYFSIPFQENEMKNEPSDPNQTADIPDSTSANSTFPGGYLDLFTKNQLAEPEISDLDVLEMMADAIQLQFNTKTNTFEMTLSVSDIGDSATFTFN